MRSRGPRPPKPKRRRARLRWRRWRARRCTSFTSRATTRWRKFARPRDRGLPTFAETCLQYLYLSLDNMDAPGFEGAKYVFTPPLREKWNQEKLWQGLAKDTLQVVSTDHCPFCYKEQKELGKDDFTKIPNGGPGIEHRLSLVYSGGACMGSAFRRTASCSWSRLHRQNFLWTVSAEGQRWPLAPMRIWSRVLMRTRSRRSALKRITCAWITRCSKEFA